VSGFLLDTNVISEFGATTPNPAVLAWLNLTPTQECRISVVTIGELQAGVTKLEARGRTRRAGQIREWIDALESQWANRILPIDIETAKAWGALRGAGRTMPMVDSLLAATAIVHDLSVVTRHTKDFEDTGVRLINPWD